MGYTIYWDPLRFSHYTYMNVIQVLPNILSPGTQITVELWGITITDAQNHSIVFAFDGKQLPYWKTNRLPHTKEAMKALVLMVEYGATENLDHDDSDMTWYLEALNEVHRKHPLVSYEIQKKYFEYLAIEKAKQKESY